MEQNIATGGATVVLAIIVVASVLSHRLRKRRSPGGRALPIAMIATAGLLVVGALLAVTGGVFG